MGRGPKATPGRCQWRLRLISTQLDAGGAADAGLGRVGDDEAAVQCVERVLVENAVQNFGHGVAAVVSRADQE